MALSRETVVAEFYRLASGAGLDPEVLLPRDLFGLKLSVEKCLDIRSGEARDRLNIGHNQMRAADASACQAVGAAAHHLGLEGIIAPSATGIGHIVAVFTDRLSPESVLTAIRPATWTEAPLRERTP